VTERVAREGYVALAPDYFHRTGPGIELGYDDAGMQEGMKHLMRLTADGMIRAALKQQGGPHEVVVYPDADHGFFCDQRPTYHEPSARDAWTRVKRLFSGSLRP
jgi:dienelactone hydrolase